jgi:hypothetical protein
LGVKAFSAQAQYPGSYRQCFCAKQGEFTAKICFEVLLSVFNAPRGEPESRAGGELAAQELNQLIGGVAEGPANAVATARISDFVQQH